MPNAKTPPKNELAELTVLLYGPRKFGKSTICSQSDNALFLATEPGLNSLNVFQVPIATWDELLASCKEIAEGKHPFRTVILDTVDNAYRQCVEHVCQKHKIDHESDLGYGKGYALVNNEFSRVLNKLAMLPYGLFLVSHSQEKEIETRIGKFTKTIPTLPEKARQIVLGMADMILYCDLEPEAGKGFRRVIRTKPHISYEAGDRTGRLPETIDFGFQQFVQAFTVGKQTPSNSTSSTPVGEAPKPDAAGAKPPSAETKPAATGASPAAATK